MAPTVEAAWRTRSATRAYGAHLRALDSGRWADALAFGVEALTYAELGYAPHIDTGPLSETVDTLLSGDGVTIAPLATGG